MPDLWQSAENMGWGASLPIEHPLPIPPRVMGSGPVDRPLRAVLRRQAGGPSWPAFVTRKSERADRTRAEHGSGARGPGTRKLPILSRPEWAERAARSRRNGKGLARASPSGTSKPDSASCFSLRGAGNCSKENRRGGETKVMGEAGVIAHLKASFSEQLPV